MTPRLHIDSVVICDDVRKEFNGKDMLIGVQGTPLIFPAFPANIKLGFWVQFSALKLGSFTLEARLKTSREAVLAHAQFNINVDFLRQSALWMLCDGIQVQTAESMVLELKESDRQWETIKVIPILLHAVAPKGVTPAPIAPKSEPILLHKRRAH